MPTHHAPDGRFRNPWPDAEPRGVGDLLKWAWERRVHGTPEDPEPGVFAAVASAFARPRAAPHRLTATWVGHATVLLQVGGLNVLTDPMWSDRASPVRFAGPRRWVPAAVALDALPPIDLVLLSHNHYDHLDDRSVRRLARAHPDALWATPLRLGSFLRRRGVRRVVELDWWEEAHAGGATVGCVPAQHFSARGPTDRMRTLWCGFTLGIGARRIYFAGDTALHPEFAEIARRRGPFDLVVLPIGAYEPRWFMRRVHMNPQDALAAYRALVAADAPPPPMLAIHWGTFKLTDEPMDEPPRAMRALWREAGLREETLWVLRHGETRELRA